eukprot:TRINITY_DN5964_c0_g1_i1.p1 TRINITY_DN5964_c0_g1~~TRINITY_DN5964_c0_g1_i1.p1  ORF type:complete len:453 (+),score=60.35 TRINITY_DN5964_c0_g1_i1:43-1359(+)
MLDTKASGDASVSPFPPGVQDVSSLLLHEHARVCAIMDEWKTLHQQTCEKQIKLLQEVVEAHRCTTQGLLGSTEVTRPANVQISQGWKPLDNVVFSEDSTTSSAKPVVSCGEGTASGAQQDASCDNPTVALREAGSAAVADSAMCAEDEEFDIEEHLEELSSMDSKLDVWRRSSGLHTVHKWVSNYRKHPAGWGALLMIHGIPEVTGRLRSKVENYAIYSALFLSVSMGLLTAPPDFTIEPCTESGSVSWWECEIQKRFFFYLLAIGVSAHMLSILLGMVFIDVLNEAARDSDIYRMFSRGKGFLATVKCARAFAVGCLADILAMLCAAKMCMGWEMVVLGAVLAGCVWWPFHVTKNLLYGTGSIVGYWREELGGKPDADDPYDLSIPLSCMQKLHEKSAAFNKAFSSITASPQPKRKDVPPNAYTNTQGKAAVKAFF